MTSDFEPELIKHFEDDANNFGKQNAKIDKLGEQMVQNGQHLSYFSKNILELKDMLKEQIEINKEQSIKLDEHIKRVEPMLKSYEFNTELSGKAKSWGGGVIFIAAVITAFVYLRHELVKLLQ